MAIGPSDQSHHSVWIHVYCYITRTLDPYLFFPMRNLKRFKNHDVTLVGPDFATTDVPSY